MSTISVRDLRTRIAEIVAGNKAYDVPAVCARLGLAAGGSVWRSAWPGRS